MKRDTRLWISVLGALSMAFAGAAAGFVATPSPAAWPRRRMNRTRHPTPVAPGNNAFSETGEAPFLPRIVAGRGPFR